MSRDLHNGVTEQAKASIHRHGDANALFQASRWRGAMYIAGYAIECLLKVKLMQKFRCSNLRDLEPELQNRNLLPAHRTIYTHDLETLLRIADDQNRLRQNRMLWPQFSNVNRWVPAWRYKPDLGTEAEAEKYLAEVDNIRQWIDNNL